MQNQNISDKCEVLIIGAGPTGLMMACQLAMQGINYRIIDKKERSSSYSGALVVQARSLEIFDQMGIADLAIQQGVKVENINFFCRGKQILNFKLDNIDPDITGFPFFLLLEQSKTELLLTGFINNRGYSVERETELINFIQTEEYVVSTLRLPNGDLQAVKTNYLIGADGGHSSIRKQLNIPFKGTSYRVPLFVLDCYAETKLPDNEISFLLSNYIIAGLFPLTEKKWRIDSAVAKKLEKKSPIAFADVAENFAERIGMPIKLQKPQWFSVFHLHERLASTFQINRCFLLGDAAHIHSPIGAQGMNTGMQDAFNLAWKLSLVLRNKAMTSLLTTYTKERRLVAAKLIRITGLIFNLLTNRNYIFQTVRIYVLPFLVKAVNPLIGIRYIRCYIFKSMSELNIKYRPHSLSHATSSGFFRNAPKAGERFPNFIFIKNGKKTAWYKMTEVNMFHLLIFAKKKLPEEILTLTERFKSTLSLQFISYSPETQLLYKKLNIRTCGFFLVRPDMHIAYRTNKPDARHFEKFLNNIFA